MRPGGRDTTAPSVVVEHLSKRYARRLALHDVSTTIGPGTLVGLLGPNGSGKTTLLRTLVGLERPTAGRALVNGRPIHRVTEPALEIGPLLDPAWFHPKRTARAHLTWMVQAAGLPSRRIEEVLELTGLAAFADEAVGGYSLGMRQRLGVAGALLGDPDVLAFDEPFNGLDQEATRWLASFVVDRVGCGGIVLLSSHQLAELEPLVDRLLVLGRGQVLFDGTPAEASGTAAPETVVVPLAPGEDEQAMLAAAHAGGLTARVGAGRWVFPGAEVGTVATVLARAGIPVRTIEARGTSLHDTYERLVAGATLPDPSSAGAPR